MTRNRKDLEEKIKKGKRDCWKGAVSMIIVSILMVDGIYFWGTTTSTEATYQMSTLLLKMALSAVGIAIFWLLVLRPWAYEYEDEKEKEKKYYDEICSRPDILRPREKDSRYEPKDRTSYYTDSWGNVTGKRIDMDDGRYVYTDRDGNIVAHEIRTGDSQSTICDRDGNIIGHRVQ